MAEVGIIVWSEAHRSSFSKDLSAIIDIEGIRKLKAGVRRNQSVQIDHRSALPDECVQEVSAVG